jgi:hypothetical protein
VAWHHHLPLAQVGHVDEALFTCISDNLATLAAEAPLSSVAAAAAAAVPAAAIPAVNSSQTAQPQGSQPSSQQSQPLQQAPHASKSSKSSRDNSPPSLLLNREKVEAAADPQAAAAVPKQGVNCSPARKALQPGVVVRTLWAFAMQGRHDDPLFEQLAPHAQVGVA